MRLRRLRRDAEMTQEQLAKLAGVHKATICMIERGAQRPSLDLAKDIAKVFGLPVEQVFEYIDVPAVAS